MRALLEGPQRRRGAILNLRIRGALGGHYPYGDDRFVYNVTRAYLTDLPLKEALSRYLQSMDPTGNSGFPAAGRGGDTDILTALISLPVSDRWRSFLRRAASWPRQQVSHAGLFAGRAATVR
jgi:hypothetical protein